MSEEKKKEKVRRVNIPEDISINMLAGGQGPKQKFPYAYFIEFLLNAGKTLNGSSQGARMAVHIDDAFRAAELGYFDLEQKPQPQWQALKEAAENPGQAYPVPGRYLISYIDSIVDAEEVEVE